MRDAQVMSRKVDMARTLRSLGGTGYTLSDRLSRWRLANMQLEALFKQPQALPAVPKSSMS